eukprot:scaffold1286_cov124-Skeletonema_marinoi.AAC.5
MGQLSNDAAMMDALIESYGEECAGGMEHIAVLMMNLLLLLFHVHQHMMTRLQLFPINALPQLRPAKINVGTLQV